MYSPILRYLHAQLYMYSPLLRYIHAQLYMYSPLLRYIHAQLYMYSPLLRYIHAQLYILSNIQNVSVLQSSFAITILTIAIILALRIFPQVTDFLVNTVLYTAEMPFSI